MLAAGLFPRSGLAQAGDPELAALSIGIAPFELQLNQKAHQFGLKDTNQNFISTICS